MEFAEDAVRRVALVREVPAILTNRLKLISLARECLLAMLNGDYVTAGAFCEFTVSPDSSLLRHSSIQRRLAMIERDPDQHPWMYRAIVRKSDNVMVGHISFHHKAPDPDLIEYSGHAAELGYAIDVVHRRKGYARESALAMMEWANRQKVETFCLSISPENMPSLRLAESMGFRKMSERMDETDGLEYVYIADMNTIRRQAKAEQ
jgi:RimJ/RimL family protein N-acetyltransferase